MHNIPEFYCNWDIRLLVVIRLWRYEVHAMNKVWILPYDLWEVGFEISHTHCMNQRCWIGIKDKARSGHDHLTSSIAHIPLCMCMCLWNLILCLLCFIKGHFTHEAASPWPLHVKHSHWWKRRSRSKFASHYAWGTNGVLCECKMDVKSTWILTWYQMDHVSWSLGLFSKTISWR